MLYSLTFVGPFGKKESALLFFLCGKQISPLRRKIVFVVQAVCSKLVTKMSLNQA